MATPHFEYSHITPQITIGTNMCCSMHEKDLVKLGFEADTDLEQERQETPPKIDFYLWLPIKDHSAPSQDQLKVGALFIKDLVEAGKKIYVHCKNGHGRAPTLVAAYFILQGMSVDKAIKTIAAKRPEIHLEPPQLKALDEFASAVETAA